MNNITDELLKIISSVKDGTFKGAYNIREDGQCAGRRSSENISIEPKTDKPGIDIRIKPGTKGETVYIPACVTHAGVDDLVYNDFWIGEGADVIIEAGCGVHNDGDSEARHNGIHRFFLEKDAHIIYKEKHVAQGAGKGAKRIDPVTEATLALGACLEMDTVQLGGVTTTTRKTAATLAEDARVVVRERIMTSGEEFARTEFTVYLNGAGSVADLISRSVARGQSRQEFASTMVGNAPCTGHSECDAILAENGSVLAQPGLEANHVDAALIHEAAIGKIAGEQLLKLRTLGLTSQEAEERIIQGFLK
ncbi:MAG: SufB/SufD family protein [Candidatus Heteroscillospira sp.]|jgi:Fe-S cluster assembly scaffold protein SufB